MVLEAARENLLLSDDMLTLGGAVEDESIIIGLAELWLGERSATVSHGAGQTTARRLSGW